MSPSGHATFNPDQLQHYFDYIELPEDIRGLLKSSSPSDRLKLLTALTRHQLTHVPFENLDLHYAPIKGISLNISHLFHKIVERQAGRGGYCCQANKFFATVLRSLGYNVICTCARLAETFMDPNPTYKTPDDVNYGGFSHEVLLVTIGDTTYLVDVGNGANGPTGPVALIDGHTEIHIGTPDKVSSSMQITRGYIGNISHTPEQTFWRYNLKFCAADDESKNWQPKYCFMGTELLDRDFEMLSRFVSTDPESIFVKSIMYCKFLAGVGEHGDAIVGELTMMDGAIKERRFGESKVLRNCENEEERVEALKEFLGVKLSDEEVEGIRGYQTEIKKG